ncbi:MAG: aldehyde dehydrogenase family protein [Tissierellia bacterium]|nr:aldehyde dehydrogenase family protein [Tissierellia bacterium]
MFSKQKEYLKEGHLRTYSLRLLHIHQLKKEILSKEKAIINALKRDIGKSDYESYMMEYYLVLSECDYFIKHLKNLVTPKKLPWDLSTFPAKKRILYKPYGQVLIQSPWNYPFQLALIPVIGAICAGNTVVLKTSRKVPHVNEVLGEIFQGFPKELIYFAEEESHDEILEYPFDFYFFTGSKKVGKKIYEIAAKNMAPIVLELGGKSPCIIDETASIDDAAKKIAWGKFSNGGQTCVAPDYVLIHHSKKKPFIQAMKKEMKAYQSEDQMARIITEEKFQELRSYLEDYDEIIGGETIVDQRILFPTLLPNVTKEDAIMEEEIFGPILPILSYDDFDEAIDIVLSKDTPLALYLFSKDHQAINRAIMGLPYGSSCLNDTLIQLASHDLPFGGLHESGMGNYHGKHSFYTFSHETAFLKGSSFKNPLRFPPYTSKKLKWLDRFMK